MRLRNDRIAATSRVFAYGGMAGNVYTRDAFEQARQLWTPHTAGYLLARRIHSRRLRKRYFLDDPM